MMTHPAALTDALLLERARTLARAERSAAALLLAHLAEIHRRGAAVKAGFPSLFAFCVESLKLSHGAAYARLQAVRAAESRPEIYALIRDGELNMTTVALICDHLERRPELLRQALGKSTREVQRLVAQTAGAPARPDKVSFVRPAQLPGGSVPATASDDGAAGGDGERNALALSLPTAPGASAGAAGPAARPAAQTPSSPPAALVEIRFTAPEGFLAALERLRAALWHKHPAGRIADVLSEAVNDFLGRRDPARKRRAVRTRSGASSRRRPPAALKRAVALRDGQRCAYVSGARRCGETRGLELDHIVPFASGGASDDAANLRLLCRAHNQSEAKRVFGDFGRPNRGG